MPKLAIASIILSLACITDVLSQDSKFLLVGPSIGVNQSWKTYDKPILYDAQGTNFETNSMTGFEGGLNVFYKSKGKFGFLGELTATQTKSSVTTNDYFSNSKIEAKESLQWLTIGGNIIFFPMPKSKALPFLGTGLYIAHLDKSDVNIKLTGSQGQAILNRNLDDVRKNKNYFVKAVGGITMNQFDKHRIVLLAIYSRSLGQLTQKSTQTFLPTYLTNDFSINSISIKVMMAL